MISWDFEALLKCCFKFEHVSAERQQIASPLTFVGDMTSL